MYAVSKNTQNIPKKYDGWRLTADGTSLLSSARPDRLFWRIDYEQIAK